MGKAKAVKKPSTPLKISTSLFRRKSKNSTGQVDKESVPSSSSGKSGKVVKSKGKGKVVNKAAGSKQSSSTGSSSSSSLTSNNAPTSKTQKKKTAAISTTASTKKGTSDGNLTQGKNKGVTKKAAVEGKASVSRGKPSKPETTTSKSKTAARNKEKEKSPSSRSVRGNSSSSNSSSSTSSSSVAEAEKVSTRKRSKSDADSPPSPVQQKMAKSEEGESRKNKAPPKTKKVVGKGSTTTSTTASSKKVTKKIAVSVVASKKKKPPVKVEKPSVTAKSKVTKGSQKDQKQEKATGKGNTTNKPVKKKGNSDKTKGGATKPKIKPRPKIKLKRMASLNAKAILEASFSFEPQEKKQRSPAPSSYSIATKVKNIDDGIVGASTGKDSDRKSPSNGKPIIGSSSTTQKGNDDIVKAISVSTSTSPPPPPPSSFLSSSVPGKVVGEKKRKSSETTSRRESTTSNKSTTKAQSSSTKDVLNYPIKTSGGGSGSNSKTGSRRNSTAFSDSSSGAPGKMSKKSKKESPSPKKKTKVSTASTSTTTSTATSPLLSPEFYPEEKQKKSKHKHKKEKSRGVDSGTNTYAGEAKNQDSGIQSEHLNHHQPSTNIKQKSAGCQAKEKKSTTPVAHFGTIYQPAGPLIEPHKSVPVGLLPETVKLPPDLKVTYQTHPPTSNAPTVSHSSSSKASRKHASSSSSTSTSSNHHNHKSDKSGQILHQPYKSSLPSSSSSMGSPSMSSRPIQPNYSGISYVNTATGSPLLSSSSMLSQQQQSSSGATVVQQQHQQLASSTTGLMSSHHHHSISSTGSSVGMGPSSSQHPQQPSVSAGAPSAGGLFYSSSTGFAPHHSPFAPNKYPMVPPDSYRNSPYPNSFLYPPTTPQPSQSYFMTPFYTPPLTPNSTPVISGGLGSIVSSQPRPLPLAAHHHPAIAAASFYHPQQSGPQPSALHHPSNYLVASPHHSIQPAPAAPGHAGLFHPNQSTLPACPCPTESCQLNNTNSNRPQQQQQCVSNGSLPVQEAGAKPKSSQQALVSTTATRPSRQFLKDISSQQPPTCTTPAVAADPPITIQLLNSNVDVQQSRQLESAKTFTEQYSLPDDITITPIIVANPNNNSSTTKLHLMNTSISVVSKSSVTNNSSSTSPNGKNSHNNSLLSKKKEKDIVHVIDPRSGQKTTIAKHISNKNLLASKINNNNKTNKPTTTNIITNANKNGNPSPALGVSRLNPNINKIGSVGKLNPDLDVIVINNNGNRSNNNDITENMKFVHTNRQFSNVNANNKVNNKKLSSVLPNNLPLNNRTHPNNNKGKKVQQQPRRVALVHNDNHSNGPRKIAPKKNHPAENLVVAPLQSTFNYSLPPGISISAGIGMHTTSNTLNNITGGMQNHHNLNVNVRPMAVQNIQKSDVQNNKKLQQQQQQQHHLTNSNKAKKRISLNECIDGLQKKRLKLLEDHNFIVNANGNCDAVNGNVILPNFANGKARHHGVNPSLFNNKGLIRGLMVKDNSATSARVRDPELNLGGTVIKSSDAVVAVSAVVLDHENYHLTRRSAVASKVMKNGLKKGKSFQQNRKSFIQTSSTKKGVNQVSSSSSKVKVNKSSSEKSGVLNTRNTRSAVANSKIRTRLSAKPKFSSSSGNSNPADHGNSRSRSRLLRKGNQIIGGPNNRKSESDCSSSCTSRSNSAVRIVSGNVSNGKVEKEKVGKYPTQAFINAVADLYQYRRNVMLRVPRAGVGVFPSASSVTALNLPTSSGGSSSTSFGMSSSVVDKVKTQLSPGIQNVVQVHKTAFGGISPRSNSPIGPGMNIKHPVGSMAANAAKKRAMVKPLSPASVNGALLQLGAVRRIPKWSNGWRFEGEPYEAKVLLNNDDQSVLRRCYPAMRHESGDVIQTRDCVLLKSGSKKNDLPYIAKIAALWENPCDGEMMFSLLWYYRPEHTEMGRAREDMTDEIFASKHIDVNSVATIDDRCYVLTFNEYCRYRKRVKQLEEGLPDKPLITFKGTSMVNNNAAGNIATAVWSGKYAETPTPGKISPEVVFFCRKVYDFRQKRIMKNPS